MNNDSKLKIIVLLCRCSAKWRVFRNAYFFGKDRYASAYFLAAAATAAVYTAKNLIHGRDGPSILGGK
jgi:hypothetical protein